MNETQQALDKLFSASAFPADAFYIDQAFQGREIIVYGAGEAFHYFKEIVMRRYGYRPSLVLDRKFKTGDTFEGIPALSLEEYCPTSKEQCNSLVVVCLGNQHYFKEIKERLQAKNLHHVISLADIYEIHNPFNLPTELDREGFDYFIREKDNIVNALTLFNEEHSRNLFISALRLHLQRKFTPLQISPRHEQYTPSDIVLSRGHDRLLYCGASLGDMIRIFNTIGKIEELVCCEPDPNQFTSIKNHLARHHHAIAKRITILPCAVYSNNKIREFTTSDTSFGSRIVTANGNHRVQAIAIDDILPGFPVTFVIMDIEGAEPEALIGMRRLIEAHRPDLAICVYHSPSHLWEIPLYLHALYPDYRFYLRNYTSFYSETVLYATA
jgi:FkbM family methyltransferase